MNLKDVFFHKPTTLMNEGDLKEYKYFFLYNPQAIILNVYRIDFDLMGSAQLWCKNGLSE